MLSHQTDIKIATDIISLYLKGPARGGVAAHVIPPLLPAAARYIPQTPRASGELTLTEIRNHNPRVVAARPRLAAASSASVIETTEFLRPRGCLIPGLKKLVTLTTTMNTRRFQHGYPAGRSAEPWTQLTHRERLPGWVAYNPRTMRPPPLSSDTNSMKILSWNVNGLQTVVQSGFSALDLARRENFDVLCLQETHLKEEEVEHFKNLIEDYDNSYWSCSVSRLGYSGTAVISRVKPISVQYGLGIPTHDQEGRIITLEFDGFYLINAYVPNSGRGLRRLNYRVNYWDPCFSNYIKKLEGTKPVIVAGDLNCARQSMDIHNPPAKTQSAGFTVEERESFERNFSSKGLVDTFRKQHPNAVSYTFWGENQRITNKGWRLDYFLASESFADKIHDSYILPDVSFSDHSPIGLVVKL